MEEGGMTLGGFNGKIGILEWDACLSLAFQCFHLAKPGAHQP